MDFTTPLLVPLGSLSLSQQFHIYDRVPALTSSISSSVPIKQKQKPAEDYKREVLLLHPDS